MGRFPGEQSCLSLVWAVLDLLITHETNGIRINQLEHQRLKRTSYQDTNQATPEEVTAALTTTGNLSRGEFTAAKRRHQPDPLSLPFWRGPLVSFGGTYACCH